MAKYTISCSIYNTQSMYQCQLSGLEQCFSKYNFFMEKSHLSKISYLYFSNEKTFSHFVGVIVWYVLKVSVKKTKEFPSNIFFKTLILANFVLVVLWTKQNFRRKSYPNSFSPKTYPFWGWHSPTDFGTLGLAISDYFSFTFI